MKTEDHIVSDDVIDSAIKASGGVGFWTWNIKDDVAQADAVSALLFNLTPLQSCDGVKISTILSAIHHDDYERLSSIIFDLVKTGGSYSTEYRVVSRAGTIRWLFTRGHFFLDDNGQPDRGRGVIVEITDSRRDVDAWAEIDGEIIDDPINRATDHCLAAHHEMSKIGDTKLLMILELMLMELGRVMFDKQEMKNRKSIH